MPICKNILQLFDSEMRRSRRIWLLRKAHDLIFKAKMSGNWQLKGMSQLLPFHWSVPLSVLSSQLPISLWTMYNSLAIESIIAGSMAPIRLLGVLPPVCMAHDYFTLQSASRPTDIQESSKPSKFACGSWCSTLGEAQCLSSMPRRAAKWLSWM